MGLNRNISLSSALGYKGQGTYLAYILHRIGGSALFIFFTVYVLSLAGVSAMQALMSNWVFQIVFLIFGLFHALNGLRITLMDLRPRWFEHINQALTVQIVIYLLLAGWAIFTILRNAFGG
ncbi:MAG: hypothetical protein IT313_13635 [Anaerolineales bacterium]|nr:hypothetical protein [Anaerolineales bacterium]